MIQVEQEKKYRILKNESGDLMFLIRGRLKNAENPRIVYDGKDHALFYRNSESTIVLDYIHPMIQSNLARATQVLIVEAQGDSIVREYMAEVKIIKELPRPNIEEA